MTDTDVYEFVDNEEEVANPFISSATVKHKAYVRHSLAKNWTNFGDNCVQHKRDNEFKLKLKIRYWNNETKIVDMTYKTFVNHFRNILNNRYVFLPSNQINELVRQLWNKYKTIQLSRRQSVGGQRVTPKSSLKSFNRRQIQSKKRVSFELIDNQSDTHLVGVNDKRRDSNDYSLNRSKNKRTISRFVKPLDINFESPAKRRSDKPIGGKPVQQINRSPEIPDSDELLEMSSPIRRLRPPLSSVENQPNKSSDRELFLRSRRQLNIEFMDKSIDSDIRSQKKSSEKKSKKIETKRQSKSMSPETGRHSDCRLSDKLIDPIVEFEDSSHIAMDSSSEQLLEESPVFNGLLTQKKTKAIKKNIESFCSPVLNQTNSTKTLKSIANKPSKKKTIVMTKAKPKERFVYSKKRLFNTPDKQINEQWISSEKTDPKRVKTSVSNHQLKPIVNQNQPKDSLCDLFERDVSQNDYEISLTTDPLMN